MGTWCRRYNFFSSLIAACSLLAILWTSSSFAQDPGMARKDLKAMGLEYTEQQFATSAGAGDLTSVKLFLDAGMDVNAGGSAALGLAAGRGQIAMVKFLLSKDAKPSANALQFARTRGHREIEKMLIEAGAQE